MKRILLSFSAIVGLTAAAHAADAIDYGDPAPYVDVAPERFGWSGAYAGIQLGYGFANIEGGRGIDNDDDGTFEDFVDFGDADSIVGGAHLGYLFQTGSFVFGPEFDLDVADFDDDGLQIDLIARAKLRGGVAFERLLVTGMVGYGHVFGEYDNSADNDQFDVDGGGLLGGAGVDYAFTDNIVLGADYIYHAVGELEDTADDVDLHTIRARASYKF